jgi:hypothetical protein
MRIIGNPFGEFRGKLTGTVYSRNKAGAVARAYVIPSNRNTVAQQKGRARLAAASGGYKYLSGAQVGAWNAFAKESYSPVNGRVGVSYTGANAYMGLRVSALAGLEVGQECGFKQGGSSIDASAVFFSYTPVDTAPSSGLGATMDTDGAGTLSVFSLEDVTITSNYLSVVKLGFTKVAGIGAEINRFDSLDGVHCGIALYISTPNKGQGRRYKQKEANTQFICKAPTVLAGDTSGGSIEITQTTAAPVGEWLSAYTLGDYLLASAYFIAADGRRALIGTKEVQITAP